MNRQPDLFDVEKVTTAEVIRFPLPRRLKAVRHAARTLQARKTDEGKRSAWDRICRDLAAGLRKHGADSAEVKSQLAEFHNAVSDELGRIGPERQQG